MSEIDYFDMESVKRELEAKTTDEEKESFCDEVIDFLETEHTAIYRATDFLLRGLPIAPMTEKQSNAADVLKFAHARRDRAKRAIDREWKRKEMASRDSAESEKTAVSPEETIKARKDQLKAVYIALAVHALLDAANLPEDVSAAKVAKFIARLAGLHVKGFEPHLAAIKDKSLSPEQYEFVANLFDGLQLDRLAEDVRRNIQ